MTAATQVLSGADRIEFWPKIGRDFRMGTPDMLRVSTLQRIREAIASRDFPRARQYLAYIHPVDMMMLQCLAEWIMHWREQLAKDRPSAAAAIVDSATAAWRGTLQSPEEAARALEAFLRLSPMEFAAGAVELIRAPQTTMGKLLRQIDQNDGGGAASTLPQYVQQTRDRHDLLARWLWAIPGTVSARCGQTYAEQAMAVSFCGCSFHEPMMRIFESLTPPELAAFLAEHLRFHFSGPGRDGSAEIIEEPDRYRVVFDPCGSGGAMRRASAGQWEHTLGLWREASPLTWNCTAGVPAYCAHCANNELNFIARNGFPLWVTEFNPDPDEPCGWTVYKEKALIPPRYFERLARR